MLEAFPRKDLSSRCYASSAKASLSTMASHNSAGAAMVIPCIDFTAHGRRNRTNMKPLPKGFCWAPIDSSSRLPHFRRFSCTSLRDPVDAESTLTQRNLHRIGAGSPYSELVRQAAFIVQLWTTEGSQFTGLVEDVDTGKQVKFLREQELLDFLRERFHPDAHTDVQKEGTDERKDGRR